MPKKKTGQRKKAEKAKIRQKLLRTKGLEIDLINHPSNILMVCLYFVQGYQIIGVWPVWEASEKPSILLFLPVYPKTPSVLSLW